MALRSEGEELVAAWRALAGDQAAEGWRTIPIVPVGPCRLLAGRHFPGNEEALLWDSRMSESLRLASYPRGGGSLCPMRISVTRVRAGFGSPSAGRAPGASIS